MTNLKHAILVLCISFALLMPGCKRGEKSAKSVLNPNVAGQFYPQEADALKSMVEDFFKKAPDIKFSENALGFMSPHAGYVFSGPVAAYIFKNLPQGRYKTVVILFPSHYERFRGVLALDEDAYHTPLGDVPIDRESLKKLMAADSNIFWDRALYHNEHACEVMLPYLQERLGNSFKIVPLMLGDQNPNMARHLAEILNSTFGADQSVLYIASSDMSHYKDYATANAMDSIALTQIMHLDSDALVGDLATGRTELCGYGAVLTLMHLSRMRGGESAKVLKHLNSGDTQGDTERGVVGYGAVEFFSK